MSRKLSLPKYQIVTTGDMSADVNSKVTNIQDLDNVGIQCNYTGSPVGTLDVQVSIDYSQDSNGNVLNAGNWISLGTPYQAQVSGAGNTYFDVNQISAPWIRTKYTFSSGTGTLNAFITAKSV